MKFKSRYQVPSNIAYHTKIEGASLTSQKYLDRVNLNRIVGFESGQLIIKDEQAFLENFDESRLYNDFSSRNESTLDCTGLTFQELSNNLAGLTNEFNCLPSEVRRMYHDNVNEFLDAVVSHQRQQSIASPVTTDTVQTVEAPSNQSETGSVEKSV